MQDDVDLSKLYTGPKKKSDINEGNKLTRSTEGMQSLT